MQTHIQEIGNVSLYFIGDVYGRLDKLTELLTEIDFDIDDPESSIQFVKLVFCGNLLAKHTHNANSDHCDSASTDSQPEIEHLALLKMVKLLVDKGHAYCLLGQHEYEVIGWSKHHPITDNPYLEASSAPLFNQELQHSQALLFEWVDWFMALPIYMDFGHIRAIHACWDDKVITSLNAYLTDVASNDAQPNSLSQQFWPAAFDSQHPLNKLIATCLDYPTMTLTELHPHSALKVPVVIGHYPQDTYPDIINEQLVCINYNPAKQDYPLVSFAWHQGRKKSLDVESAQDAQMSLGEFCFIDQPSAEECIAEGTENLLDAIVSTLDTPQLDEAALIRLHEKVAISLCTEWDPLGIKQTMHARHPYQPLVKPVTQLALDQDTDKLTAYLAIVSRFQLETDNDNLENSSLKTAYKLTRLANNYL